MPCLSVKRRGLDENYRVESQNDPRKKRAARRSATPANGADSLMVAAVVPAVGGQFGRFLILNVCLLRELNRPTRRAPRCKEIDAVRAGCSRCTFRLKLLWGQNR